MPSSRTTLREGGAVTGRVTGADEDAVTLDVDGSERVLPYAELVRGNVQVEFGRKGEPVDEPDADEVEPDEEDDA